MEKMNDKKMDMDMNEDMRGGMRGNMHGNMRGSGHFHNGMMCDDRMCWGGHRFSILRFIILLLLVTFIFSVGVRFGEFKGQFESEYGYGHDMHRGMMMYGNGYGNDMMYGNGGMMMQSMPTQQMMPATPVPAARTSTSTQ